MLASVVVWYVRKRKALQSTAQHGTTGHSSAPHARHDTARHRTALRRAVELAKLNAAGDTVYSFVLSAILAGCDTKKELEPHLRLDVPIAWGVIAWGA